MRWIIHAAAMLLCATGAHGADLTVLSAGAVRSALDGLAADWSHETGHRVSVSYAAAGDLRKRLASGERADILILPQENFEALEREGLVERAARRDLGAVRTELQKATIYTAAVMKGAPAAGVAGMLLDHLASEAGRKAFIARGFGAP